MVDHRHVVGQSFGFLDVVGGHQHGDALRAQVINERPEFRAHLRVEAHGWFIQQHQFWLLHQTPGDQKPAFHPAREGFHHRVTSILQSGDAKGAVHCGGTVSTVNSLQGRPHVEFLFAGEFHVEVVLLGYHTHARACFLGAFGNGQPKHFN